MIVTPVASVQSKTSLRHRRADADLDHAARFDQAFLDGVKEHRAVGERLTEIVGPGVDMGIEMHERRADPRFFASARNSANVTAMFAAQRRQGDAIARRLLLDQR